MRLRDRHLRGALRPTRYLDAAIFHTIDPSLRRLILKDQPSIQRRPIPAHNDLYGDADTNLATDASPSKEKPPERSVLLATGSADPYAYLYNVGEVSVLAFICQFLPFLVSHIHFHKWHTHTELGRADAAPRGAHGPRLCRPLSSDRANTRELLSGLYRQALGAHEEEECGIKGQRLGMGNDLDIVASSAGGS